MEARQYDDFSAWIGRREHCVDVVAPSLLARIAATFDDEPNGVLPPLGHWCICVPAVSTAELGADGHPRRGDFLPPTDLPRRMWAGGRVEWLDEVRANERVQRTSTVTGVQHKEGRSGPLLFVTVEHEFGTERGVAIRERQDIVYRDHSTATVDGIAVDAGEWCSRVLPTEVLLFRYSALTFNAHRIHHDLRYAGEVEGYPGLVVHGPLMATLLARCAASTVGPLRSFEFRATKPVIAPSPIEICGARTDKGCTMWVRDVRGHQCVAATVTAAT